MVKGRKTINEVNLGKSEFGFDVKEKLLKYVDILVKSPINVKCIILMGSRARGDWKTYSDCDVVVIAENLPESYGDILREVYPREVLGISLEVRVYTPNDFLEALISLDLTALDAMEEGIVLYDDDFWDKAVKVFENVKKSYDLRRIDGNWIALNPF